MFIKTDEIKVLQSSVVASTPEVLMTEVLIFLEIQLFKSAIYRHMQGSY